MTSISCSIAGSRDLVRRTHEAITKSFELTWETIKPDIRWIGIFGLITHPLYLVVNNALGNGLDSVALRIAALLGCAITIGLPKFEREYGERSASILAVFLLFFVLPFFFLWTLFQNALSIHVGPEELASRQVQCALALMATALLIYDRATLVVGLLVCFVAVFLCAIPNMTEDSWDLLVTGVFSQLPFWVFAVIAGAYFNRNRALVEREKFKTLFDTGGYLAHELRTPLAGTSIKLHGLRKLIGSDHHVDTELRVTSEKEANAINRGRIDRLCVGAIDDVVYANALIDMFLVRAGVTGVRRETKTLFLASDFVNEALERYPYSSLRESECLEVEIVSDFRIEGPFILLTHVILNLLRNALKYVASKEMPEVVVRVSSQGSTGIVEVIDNGVGIPKADQLRIFDSFFTTSRAAEGAGVGLSFCQKVVSGLDGSISVHSIPDVLTTFKIRLPRAPDST